MWEEKVSLNEALDLAEECEEKEMHSKQRWYTTYRHIIRWQNSPTGFAKFHLCEPNSFEETGMMDVNLDKILLTAVEPVEVTKIEYKDVKD